MKRLLFLLLMASAQINAAQPSSNRPVTVSISMGKDLDPFVEITNANFIKENTLLQDEITSNPDVKNHNIILEPSHRVTKEGIEILEKLTGKSMEAARDMIRLLEAESLADALLNAEFLGNKYLQEILTMLAKKLRYEGLNSNLETLFDTQGKDGNYTIHSAIRKELIKEILKLFAPEKLIGDESHQQKIYQHTPLAEVIQWAVEANSGQAGIVQQQQPTQQASPSLVDYFKNAWDNLMRAL